MTWEGRLKLRFLRVLHQKEVTQRDVVLSWILSLHSSPLLSLVLTPLHTDRISYTCCKSPAHMPKLYPTYPVQPQNRGTPKAEVSR